MKTKIIASAIAILTTQAAFAEEHKNDLQWNNVEVDYVAQDIEGAGDFDPKGVSIKGTKLIHDNIFLVGGYTYASESLNGSSIENENLSVGVGYQKPISSRASVYSTLTYEDYEVENIDFDGFNVAVGMRYLANENLELDTRVTNINIDGDNELAFKAKGYYKVKEDLFVGLGYNFYQGNNGQLEAGVRYSF
tara:strand:- start:21424 stop:21999 length:576 start_codon:yes stop_codon:yes gene_type:complete